MRILLMYRNLLSKSKLPMSHYPSSNLCFYRRIFSEAAAHDPSVVGDMKPNSSKPMFLIDHVHEGINNYSLLSVAKNNNNNNNSWKDQHHRICSPFSGGPDEYDLVGSCKEWILFWSSSEELKNDYKNVFWSKRQLTLWNPTTNRIKTLPPPLLPRLCRVNSVDINRFGLGFDPKSHDYKLVCFLKHDCFNGCKVVVELYSLKTDSWKHITPSLYAKSNYLFHDHSVHINGVNYWASDRIDWHGNRIICCFDFGDEKFSEIPLPDTHSYLERMHNNYCLAEFHESPAIIVPYWVPTQDLTEEEKQQHMQQPFTIGIWVWNGETWNVAPRCAVGDFPVGYEIARLRGLFQNEYLFIQGKDEAELMLFNCKTGKVDNLGIQHDDPPESSRPQVFPFTVPI